MAITSFNGLIQQSFSYLGSSLASQLGDLLENPNASQGQNYGQLFDSTMEISARVINPATEIQAANIYWSSSLVGASGEPTTSDVPAQQVADASGGQYVTLDDTPLGKQVKPPRCLAWIVTTAPCLASGHSLPADVSLFG
jgi:hypothetical protein